MGDTPTGDRHSFSDISLDPAEPFDFEDDPEVIEVDEPPGRKWRRADVAIVLGYLLFALILYSGQWLNFTSGYLWNSASDQNLWEWFFDVTARNVVNLDNPLSSNLQNYPLSVNMMANTAMLGLGIPLTPITLLFGPTVTSAIALTGGLAGSAAAWYWVFSRHLVSSRPAAAIGGAFCGFAPSMVSHGNAHPNFVAWFLLPFIVLKLIQLAQGQRPVRNGVILGLLTAYQIFLGEEPLLITGVTFLIFGLAYALSKPCEILTMIRPFATGCGIGAAVALVITAFPLWWQFFGPESYQAIEHGSVGNDTAAFTRFATQSIAGDAKAAVDVSMNRTEENAFFGWPLIVFMVVLTIWLWRDRFARSMAIAMYVMAWLSLGVQVIVAHEETGIPGPWKWFNELPLLESVLESRFAMGCVPLIGALLAVATHRVFALGPGTREVPLRLLWIGTILAVLLPIAPTKLIVKDRPPTPQFFADCTWKSYVSGGTVVTVPLPSGGESEPLHWQMDAGLGFSMPEGYFVGPNGPDDKRGRYGAVQRPTSILLDQIRQTGTAPPIDDTMRARAIDDLKYWNADVLVLIPRQNEFAFRSTVDLLLNKPGQFVNGVWVWDTRALTP